MIRMPKVGLAASKMCQHDSSLAFWPILLINLFCGLIIGVRGLWSSGEFSVCGKRPNIISSSGRMKPFFFSLQQKKSGTS